VVSKIANLSWLAGGMSRSTRGCMGRAGCEGTGRDAALNRDAQQPTIDERHSECEALIAGAGIRSRYATLFSDDFGQELRNDALKRRIPGLMPSAYRRTHSAPTGQAHQAPMPGETGAATRASPSLSRKYQLTTPTFRQPATGAEKHQKHEPTANPNTTPLHNTSTQYSSKYCRRMSRQWPEQIA
jgi:hypothetical protein